MQKPPAWVIAAWPEPNYVDPETHGWGNVILNIVLYVVLCCFISLRIWTRTRLRASFGADDMMILFAMVGLTYYPDQNSTTGFFVLSLLADLKFMWTRHQYDIPSSHVEFGLKMVLLIEIMFASACTFTKLSMLMLVRRMLTSATIFWRRVTLAAICIVGLQGALFCIVLVFQCRPPQDYWKITDEPQPNCIDQSSTLLLAGIVNTLTDFLVVILPIRTVYSTNLPRRQTLIVSFLFTLGFLSCFAGVIRTYYMYQVTQTYDQVWASFPVWVSAAVELYVGIICTSIPATKVFFATYIPKIFNSHLSRPSQSSFSAPNIFKSLPVPPSGFGITSTSKSTNSLPKSKSRSNSSSKVLSSQSSQIPLNGREKDTQYDNDTDLDQTVGTSIFELGTYTNRSSTLSKTSSTCPIVSDEEMHIGTASVISPLNSNPVSSSTHNIANLGRNILGSVRRDKLSLGGDRSRNRSRNQDRENDDLYMSLSEESGRKEKEGGWDIHIDVVRTVEVEEECIAGRI
ncbi:uncharacterized protein EAF02_007622 [Botrytis sinoallii]|uniref:uncharacterized protein n=1 Tax=Botrytis sinoallii TaxID=1463999 RepID=UPI0019001D39|nr:uncharacterized protein EAF02_007622 [Botrytis sinoallii]KAF7879985.1 hypothetical protein EAF02_007622 [Botrytis sinoallii]